MKRGKNKLVLGLIIALILIVLVSGVIAQDNGEGVKKSNEGFFGSIFDKVIEFFSGKEKIDEAGFCNYCLNSENDLENELDDFFKDNLEEELSIKIIVLDDLNLAPLTGNAVVINSDKDISVIADNKELAQKILDAAECIREELALKYFGKRIPKKAYGIVINVGKPEDVDYGIADEKNGGLYINIKSFDVFGILRHEIFHAVQKYFDREMSIWYNEAIAVTEDSVERDFLNIAIKEYLEGKRDFNLNDLSELGWVKYFDDEKQLNTLYAVSIALYKYLYYLFDNDQNKVYEFEKDSRKIGLEKAFKKYFNKNLDEFMKEWKEWTKENIDDIYRPVECKNKIPPKPITPSEIPGTTDSTRDYKKGDITELDNQIDQYKNKCVFIYYFYNPDKNKCLLCDKYDKTIQELGKKLSGIDERVYWVGRFDITDPFEYIPKFNDSFKLNDFKNPSIVIIYREGEKLKSRTIIIEKENADLSPLENDVKEYLKKCEKKGSDDKVSGIDSSECQSCSESGDLNSQSCETCVMQLETITATQDENNYVEVDTSNCQYCSYPSTPISQEPSQVQGQSGKVKGEMKHSDNFIVMSPPGYGDDILKRAECKRKEISEGFFGKVLPPGAGLTIISLIFKDIKNAGAFTIMRELIKNDKRRAMNSIFLNTPNIPSEIADATGPLIDHEISHAVVNTWIPGIPNWLDEGIASSFDSEKRKEIRTNILKEWVSSRNYYSLEKLFNKEGFSPSDQEAYAASVAIVKYLLCIGGKERFFKFAKEIGSIGYAQAIQKYYGMNINELQKEFQDFIKDNVNEIEKEPDCANLKCNKNKRLPKLPPDDSETDDYEKPGEPGLTGAYELDKVISKDESKGYCLYLIHFYDRWPAHNKDDLGRGYFISDLLRTLEKNYNQDGEKNLKVLEFEAVNENYKLFVEVKKKYDDMIKNTVKIREDPEGNKESYKPYEKNGLLLPSILVFDSKGNLKDLTNGLGEIRRFEYNSLDDLMKECKKPDTGETPSKPITPSEITGTTGETKDYEKEKIPDLDSQISDLKDKCVFIYYFYNSDKNKCPLCNKYDKIIDYLGEKLAKNEKVYYSRFRTSESYEIIKKFNDVFKLKDFKNPSIVIIYREGDKLKSRTIIVEKENVDLSPLENDVKEYLKKCEKKDNTGDDGTSGGPGTGDTGDNSQIFIGQQPVLVILQGKQTRTCSDKCESTYTEEESEETETTETRTCYVYDYVYENEYKGKERCGNLIIEGEEECEPPNTASCDSYCKNKPEEEYGCGLICKQSQCVINSVSESSKSSDNCGIDYYSLYSGQMTSYCCNYPCTSDESSENQDVNPDSLDSYNTETGNYPDSNLENQEYCYSSTASCSYYGISPYSKCYENVIPETGNSFLDKLKLSITGNDIKNQDSELIIDATKPGKYNLDLGVWKIGRKPSKTITFYNPSNKLVNIEIGSRYGGSSDTHINGKEHTGFRLKAGESKDIEIRRDITDIGSNPGTILARDLLKTGGEWDIRINIDAIGYKNEPPPQPLPPTEQPEPPTGSDSESPGGELKCDPCEKKVLENNKEKCVIDKSKMGKSCNPPPGGICKIKDGKAKCVAEPCKEGELGIDREKVINSLKNTKFRASKINPSKGQGTLEWIEGSLYDAMMWVNEYRKVFEKHFKKGEDGKYKTTDPKLMNEFHKAILDDRIEEIKNFPKKDKYGNVYEKNLEDIVRFFIFSEKEFESNYPNLVDSGFGKILMPCEKDRKEMTKKALDENDIPYTEESLNQAIEKAKNAKVPFPIQIKK